MNFLLLNGPSLNLLGHREPGIYGSISLKEIEDELKDKARLEGVNLNCFQSNSEGALVDRIHTAFDQKVDGIIINAGAYTHTSIAIRDALLAVNIPYVELHLSNTKAREEFRHDSYLADSAIGLVSGFGHYSYQLAYQGLLNYLRVSRD
tara:strand:- start:5 stop:451 length:447 start_codon:yes stop_codon:yes gene_type:complete